MFFLLLQKISGQNYNGPARFLARIFSGGRIRVEENLVELRKLISGVAVATLAATLAEEARGI